MSNRGVLDRVSARRKAKHSQDVIAQANSTIARIERELLGVDLAEDRSGTDDASGGEGVFAAPVVHGQDGGGDQDEAGDATGEVEEGASNGENDDGADDDEQEVVEDEEEDDDDEDEDEDENDHDALGHIPRPPWDPLAALHVPRIAASPGGRRGAERFDTDDFGREWSRMEEAWQSSGAPRGVPFSASLSHPAGDLREGDIQGDVDFNGSLARLLGSNGAQDLLRQVERIMNRANGEGRRLSMRDVEAVLAEFGREPDAPARNMGRGRSAAEHGMEPRGGRQLGWREWQSH